MLLVSHFASTLLVFLLLLLLLFLWCRCRFIGDCFWVWIDSIGIWFTENMKLRCNHSIFWTKTTTSIRRRTQKLTYKSKVVEQKMEKKKLSVKVTNKSFDLDSNIDNDFISKYYSFSHVCWLKSVCC